MILNHNTTVLLRWVEEWASRGMNGIEYSVHVDTKRKKKACNASPYGKKWIIYNAEGMNQNRWRQKKKKQNKTTQSKETRKLD